LTAIEAAKLTSQIGSALDAAHERGLVHRDVKPANVLLDRDHAYLTDFGLTKRVDGESSMTGTGRWVGTLGYIAPEQIRSEPVDARTDVYALGCLLHYMLTGESPYRRDTDEATLFAHLNDPPPAAHVQAPDVPPELSTVIQRALAKDPADRYPSAGDLGAAALAAVGEGTARPERLVARGAAAPAGAREDETLIAGDEATPTPTPEAQTRVAAGADAAAGGAPQRPWPSGRVLAATVAGIVLVAVVAVAALSRGKSDNPENPPTETVKGLVAGKPIAVGPRPSFVTYAFDRVWVSVPRRSKIVRIDPETGTKAEKTVGIAGATTGGFGALWVVTGRDHHLLKLDPKTLVVTKRVALPPGEAVVVAADERYLWVGMRPPGIAYSSVIRVDPRSGEQKVIPFGEEGVAGLTTGGDRVWVTNRRRGRVTTLNPETFERHSSSQVGTGARFVAFGKGFGWVTNDATDWLTRITPGLRDSRNVPACRTPIGVAVSNPGVWVACSLSDQVAIFDPANLTKPAMVGVGGNPYSIAANGNRAWVSNLADGTVTPLTYNVP
jgi:hypothetical protein